MLFWFPIQTNLEPLGHAEHADGKQVAWITLYAQRFENLSIRFELGKLVIRYSEDLF